MKFSGLTIVAPSRPSRRATYAPAKPPPTISVPPSARRSITGLGSQLVAGAARRAEVARSERQRLGCDDLLQRPCRPVPEIDGLVRSCVDGDVERAGAKPEHARTADIGAAENIHAAGREVVAIARGEIREHGRETR